MSIIKWSIAFNSSLSLPSSLTLSRLFYIFRFYYFDFTMKWTYKRKFVLWEIGKYFPLMSLSFCECIYMSNVRGTENNCSNSNLQKVNTAWLLVLDYSVTSHKRFTQLCVCDDDDASPILSLSILLFDKIDIWTNQAELLVSTIHT